MREDGYYWVYDGGEWIIAEYINGQGWYLPGHEYEFRDDEFKSIDEDKITRVEKPFISNYL